MTYEITVQLTTAEDITTTHKCYYDNLDELYKNFLEACNDNEDFIITNIQPCADAGLTYHDIISRLQTLGEGWEDKALNILDQLAENPSSDGARAFLYSLRITEDDLMAWAMVDY